MIQYLMYQVVQVQESVDWQLVDASQNLVLTASLLFSKDVVTNGTIQQGDGVRITFIDQKDADFFKGFNQTSTKYPGSNEYQDKIREKAALGLDVEEATMLVMAKEGKYTSPQPEVERENAAGGSASTSMKGGESKEPERMSQAERKAALFEAEAQGIDLLKL